MDDKGSWKSDLLHLGILAGLCLFIGIYLIRGMVLISRDGAFYISQAQQLAQSSAGVARRYPAGYPFVLWLAHEVATRLAGHDSGMLWVLSAQGVTLACRVLALVPLYFLGTLLVGARNSFWALLILIVLPYPAQYGSDVLREWPHLLFLSLGFWLLCWALRTRRWWVLVFVGLDAGLGYFIRPECIQLILYGLLGLGSLRLATGGGRPARANRRRPVDDIPDVKTGIGHTVGSPAGAGFLLVAGFLAPVVPYIYATGTTVVPHQLRPPTGNEPPVISAIGLRAASDDPLDFEVQEGELLVMPIKALDPQEDPLQFSLASVPVGSRPVYEFRSPATGSHFWTIAESEKDVLLTMYSRQVWDYVGIACYAFTQADAHAGLRGVHRFWSGTQQRHFYTTDERQKDEIVRKWSQTWTYEQIAFYAFGEEDHPPDTVAIELGEGEDAGTEEGHNPPVPSDFRTFPPSSAVAWYAHPGGEPPAGATIEGGVFRWRPEVGQAGDYQINIIVSDGGLQSCQLIHVRVTADGGRKREDEQVGTQDARRSSAIVPSSDLRTFLPSDVQISLPSFTSRSPESVVEPEQAGVGALPAAADDLFTGVAEDLMIFFLVPWILGSYCRLRYLAGRVERILVPALMSVSVILVIGRHLGFGAGEDRRYSVALIALTIFYIPVGLDIFAWWIDLVHALWHPRRMVRILPHAFWFCLLLAGGLTICLPKLLTPVRADKTGYRAAAEWLRQNTKAEAVLAVPDNRIPLYAQRRGLVYTQYPDWRRADHVVVIGERAKMWVPQGWRREYSVPLDPPSPEALIIYGSNRSR